MAVNEISKQIMELSFSHLKQSIKTKYKELKKKGTCSLTLKEGDR